MMKAIILHLVVLVVGVTIVESRKSRILESFDYSAISCRGHSASIQDFGGVGDGATLNTLAFQQAVDHLSQFASDGGAQLFVPAGKWLTGSFNLTSHFTLFLHRDAVLLASQVCMHIIFFVFFDFEQNSNLLARFKGSVDLFCRT